MKNNTIDISTQRKRVGRTKKPRYVETGRLKGTNSGPRHSEWRKAWPGTRYQAGKIRLAHWAKNETVN